MWSISTCRALVSVGVVERGKKRIRSLSSRAKEGRTASTHIHWNEGSKEKAGEQVLYIYSLLSKVQGATPNLAAKKRLDRGVTQDLVSDSVKRSFQGELAVSVRPCFIA